MLREYKSYVPLASMLKNHYGNEHLLYSARCKPFMITITKEISVSYLFAKIFVQQPIIKLWTSSLSYKS